MSQYLKTRQSGTQAVRQVPNLDATHRCDRCSARAGVVVLMPSTLELIFCSHHATKFEEALFSQGAVVYR